MTCPKSSGQLLQLFPPPPGRYKLYTNGAKASWPKSPPCSTKIPHDASIFIQLGRVCQNPLKCTLPNGGWETPKLDVDQQIYDVDSATIKNEVSRLATSVLPRAIRDVIISATHQATGHDSGASATSQASSSSSYAEGDASTFWSSAVAVHKLENVVKSMYHALETLRPHEARWQLLRLAERDCLALRKMITSLRETSNECERALKLDLESTDL